MTTSVMLGLPRTVPQAPTPPQPITDTWTIQVAPPNPLRPVDVVPEVTEEIVPGDNDDGEIVATVAIVMVLLMALILVSVFLCRKDSNCYNAKLRYKTDRCLRSIRMKLCPNCVRSNEIT